MSNLLEAIVRIHNLKNLNIAEFYKSRIRANNMGEALEKFIADAFADTLDITDEEQRIIKYNKIFSYKGTQNHPPDLIIQGSDAIEVKKVELKQSSTLQLNSSYPKEKLYSDDPRITKDCKKCENEFVKEGWKEKDIIYSVGIINNKELHSLCFVYGEDYAASRDIYQKIINPIENEIKNIPDINLKKSNEIAVLDKVDPLKITSLRVRGMWVIDIPFKVFSYITKGQKYFAIINTKKYNSFPEHSKKLIENTKGIFITDHKIKEPNNPVKLKAVKLIRFKEIL